MKDKKLYQIIDDNSVIFSTSDYDEILGWWEGITGDNPEQIEWTGDLRLIEVIEIYN